MSIKTEIEASIDFTSNGHILADTIVTETRKEFAEYTRYDDLVRSLGKQRFRNTVAEFTGGGIIVIGVLAEALSMAKLMTEAGVYLTPSEAFTDQIFKVGLFGLGLLLTKRAWQEGDRLTKLEMRQQGIDRMIPTRMYESPAIKLPEAVDETTQVAEQVAVPANS